MAKDHYIELVGKVIGLLETLRDAHEGLNLQELASRTGQVKSSVHRLLQSLKRHGYVEQESAGGPYRLGLQVLTLHRGVNGSRNLLQMARPYLRELVDHFDESAYLAVLHGGRGIFVDVQESRRDLRLIGPLGAEVHYHATAAGKAIAAYLPQERHTALLKELKLEHLTEKTVKSRSQVKEEWAEVRRRGHAINDEETIVGAVFLAAPIFDAQGAVCGSLSVGLPKPRSSAQRKKEIAEHLKDACRRLSAGLEAAGYVHRDLP